MNAQRSSDVPDLVPLSINCTRAKHLPIIAWMWLKLSICFSQTNIVYLRAWYKMSPTMKTSLHGSVAFKTRRKERGEIKNNKKVPLKRWNSLNRFFQPRSSPFSADTLKCWVINRQPTSNIAWLRLIQSHSVYETQWYGHNTQHTTRLLLKQNRFT